MKVFRVLLVVAFSTIMIYTIIVGMNHGWNLFPYFFENITALNWSGQFNLDFSFYLIFTGLWIAWRDEFKLKGIIYGLIATVGGILFLAGYLMFLSFKEQNIKNLLIGSDNVKYK